MRTPWHLLSLLTCGCAVHYALPMTADTMVRHNTGAALVAYLGQPDASPSVCDLKSQGPHLTELTGDAEDALMQGLVEGKIQPALGARRANALLRGVSEPRGASLLDAQARTWWRLLRSPELEVDPAA